MTGGPTARRKRCSPQSAAELYTITGTQQLPFNTIYQLAAAAGTPQLRAASTLLLIPDLLAYWLTGEAGAEVTNPSTTGLYDITARDWARPLMRRAGIRPDLFPELRQPGQVIGGLLPDSARETGLAASVPMWRFAPDGDRRVWRDAAFRIA